MIATVLQLSGRMAGNLLSVWEAAAPERDVTIKLPRLVRSYARWWLVSLLLFTTIISSMAAHKPLPTLLAGPLEDKLAYYHEHKADFDLILLGDSLTFTGLHPEFIDPLLGSRSINMATFSHWFATQYPFVQDLIPEIPHSARVLWSVHLYDLDDGLIVQHVYPVGLANAVRYWSWGARNPGLADNVLFYSPFTRFFFERDELRSRVIGRGQIPVTVPHLISPAFAEPDFSAAPAFVSLRKQQLPDTTDLRTRLTNYYNKLPSVAGVSIISDHDQITSVALFLKGGGYYRIELMPEYFREKQQEIRAELRLDDRAAEKIKGPSIGPVSLKMFEATLAAFRQAGIRVTINVMEEAPFTFQNETIREKYRRIVDEALRPIVAGFGYDYVHADYTSIVDSDYFDYNHFNSNGIAKYSPLLVHELRKFPEFAAMSVK